MLDVKMDWLPKVIEGKSFCHGQPRGKSLLEEQTLAVYGWEELLAYQVSYINTWLKKYVVLTNNYK